MRITQPIVGTPGAGKSALFVGLDPGLADIDPLTLRRYGRMALEILEDPDFEPPEVVAPGASPIDPQKSADEFRPALLRFEGVLTAVAVQRPSRHLWKSR